MNNKKTFSYKANLLNSLSQTAHAIAGGDADVSISAAVGFLSLHTDSKFYKYSRITIDWAFRPIERNHCRNAYLADRDEYIHRATGLKLVVTALMILAACPVIRAALEYGRIKSKLTYRFKGD